MNMLANVNSEVIDSGEMQSFEEMLDNSLMSLHNGAVVRNGNACNPNRSYCRLGV